MLKMLRNVLLFQVLFVVCTLSMQTPSTCENLHDFYNIESPGDIIIGGLFAVHVKIESSVDLKKPEGQTCKGFDVRGLVKVLAMIHSIEKINNSTLLPGIKLGYKIYDTCTEPTMALRAVMKFLSKANSSDDCVEVRCNYTDYLPTVKAVIGPATSEVSISVARLLNINLMPQISYSASAKILSDKTRFPSFMRTIPSDTFQSKAMAMLVQTFEWNWVGTIASDDDYSRSGIDSFISEAELLGACIAFQEIIPFYSSDQITTSRIKEVAKTIINRTRVNVIVMFARASHVVELFEILNTHNVSKIWIASDSWSSNNNITRMEKIQNIGNIIGFTFKSRNISKFRDYVKKLSFNSAGVNTFLKKYYMLYNFCTAEQNEDLDSCISDAKYPLKYNEHQNMSNSKELQYLENDFLVNNIEAGVTSSIQWSVYALTHALQNLLKCSEGICHRSSDFAPWELLQELKKVNITEEGNRIQFDSFGNFISGYDILMWKPIKDKMALGHIIAEYDIQTNKFIIKDLRFNNFKNVVSKCSSPCQLGQLKLSSEGQHTCCYDCVNCSSDTFSNTTDAQQCFHCSEDEWAPTGSASCNKKDIMFLKRTNAFSIVLLIFSALGIVLILVIIVIFIKNINTPAVKSNGGILSIVMLLSLMLSFTSVYFFLGKPNNVTCKFRQCLFGISFTLSVSCALTKSLAILFAFNFNPANQKYLKNCYNPWLIIGICTGFQVIICALWLIFNAPRADRDVRRLPKEILLECIEGSDVAFAVMLGYIALLALICFIFAFIGRKLPENYNEAKFITFSMLIYFISWITFVPVYVTTKGQFLPAVEVVTILSSTYGILCCQFFPKCYIILFKKEYNTASSFLKNLYDFSLKSSKTICQHQISAQSSLSSLPHLSIKHDSFQKSDNINRNSFIESNRMKWIPRKRFSSL
ncbi:G-protein coupled receptor family C group 6 member A-like isoform X1 [Amblyraja radiata]|uniref:G-protein coupled receptor family C group 6 member A-like isoform X1 n=1 Tax=Amblyraja radiata TaxID=386614 RepID=UPI001401FA2A|nr:G-protein coupled receptor family C group 6 member A-like isoform X1 [Amblyraja radiata]